MLQNSKSKQPVKKKPKQKIQNNGLHSFSCFVAQCPQRSILKDANKTRLKNMQQKIHREKTQL